MHLPLLRLPVALVIGFTSFSPAFAQEAKPAGKLPADLAVLTPDVSHFISTRPADLRADKLARFLMTSFPGFTEDPRFCPPPALGLAPSAVERLTVCILPGEGPRWITSLRTREPYDRKALLAQLRKTSHPGMEEKTYKGRTVFARPDGKDESVWLLDDHSLLLGDFKELAARFERSAGKTARPGPLSAALHAAGGKHLVVVGAQPVLTPVPPSREEGKVPAHLVLSRLDTGNLPYKPLLLARSLTLTIASGVEARAGLRLEFRTAEQAEDGEVSVRVALYVLRELLPTPFRELGMPTDTRAVSNFLKSAQAALRRASVRRDGTTVQASVALKVDELVSDLRPALTDAAKLQRSVFNLRWFGVAMHNYEAVHGHMPPPAILSKDGKPLLSWRVQILPFIEEEKLYKEFKLDEQWDSPHNKKLLPRMPKVYAPVAGKPTEPHSTFYQVFTGGKAPFRLDQRQGPRIADFKGGLSNTVLVVEAGEAVPWTKPVDLAVDPKKPLPKLGGMFDKFFHALMGDGGVRRFRRDFDEKLLRLVIDPADGKAIDFEKLAPPGEEAPHP